ncbi:SHOCT domain-containing protein [Halorubrum trueperi]|uniref:SHOCT domain-containing protein n=1 Tax=Halorubrum trueperi TaxID=2004704 RepID=A0ABD5ULF6_9EURY
MTGLLRRIAWNLRHRWRRVFVLVVLGGGVAAPFLTEVWWTLPLVWFFGLFVALPVLHTLTRPLPNPEESGDAKASDPALDALRERYARGEIDESAFERKLDRLLETENAETGDTETADGTGNASDELADRVRDGIRREVERVRE